eukprot:gb/GECH01008607.1/.p1 GENE.gb/GECH01008607.1/~~gb/GECH01008607.1/.p1  ORF type:complete len:441 (+),score=111.03 gb/GECH01008607.1/:1-1323(+)
MPQKPEKKESYEYHNGFGNHFVSEAIEGTLPKGQNSPQQCPYGLYAEQLSGSAFTVPRHQNQRTWFYRIRPSVGHNEFKPFEKNKLLQSNFNSGRTTPQQLRWLPEDIPSDPIDFVEGLRTVAGAGDAQVKSGMAIHLYLANKSMEDRAFCNADGDMLIVPQQGALDIQTEFGYMYVNPGEICVIQRGIRFRVSVPDGPSRGYICEVFNGHFRLPDLGPIGANGLANPADFRTPKAAYEERDVKYEVVHKFMGELFQMEMEWSPFDVVGWHGNYAPYKYDLDKFNAMNTVTYDHADPSIFTVLTCQSNEPGVAVADFVIFPPRWAVAEHTFRPPYFHRNCMSEYMGLVYGSYEAKEKGFVPGGGSLHSCMTPHGPEKKVFEKASAAELKPERVADGTMAFMFESMYLVRPTEYALDKNLDQEYLQCWKGFEKHFQPPSKQ